MLGFGTEAALRCLKNFSGARGAQLGYASSSVSLHPAKWPGRPLISVATPHQTYHEAGRTHQRGREERFFFFFFASPTDDFVKGLI